MVNASGHPYVVHGQSTGGVPVDESNGGAGNTVTITNNGSLSVSQGSYDSELFAIDARSSGADGDRTNENNGSPGGNLVGVLAAAIGGVGGVGGVGDSENDSSGGKGGAGGDIQINLTNEGSISTTGANAYGVLGQSIGALGGNGGDDTSLFGTSGSAGAGGNGANAGSFSSSGTFITTTGDVSAGIAFQSIGGGAGGDFTDVIAGAGGSGIRAAINSSSTIKTSGQHAYGLLA